LQTPPPMSGPGVQWLPAAQKRVVAGRSSRVPAYKS
jgi:hypothetical protein